ncbi:hypothetical protein QTO34_017041 [Cnephaeus nilssonii]|uniref:Uncharacterized protein n=1 Tax=Cnephaeus nilssonii TaxID=3371016 RepID=A0AA40LNQ2_CNENI|nr:hypothetical protein QTO34_017041 [Eptesicus nilssonii]
MCWEGLAVPGVRGIAASPEHVLNPQANTELLVRASKRVRKVPGELPSSQLSVDSGELGWGHSGQQVPESSPRAAGMRSARGQQRSLTLAHSASARRVSRAPPAPPRWPRPPPLTLAPPLPVSHASTDTLRYLATPTAGPGPPGEGGAARAGSPARASSATEDGSQGRRELLLARSPCSSGFRRRTRVRLDDEMPVFGCGAQSAPACLPRGWERTARGRAPAVADGKAATSVAKLGGQSAEQCALLGTVRAHTGAATVTAALAACQWPAGAAQGPGGRPAAAAEAGRENACLETAGGAAGAGLRAVGGHGPGGWPPRPLNPRFCLVSEGAGTGPMRWTRWHGSGRPCRRSSRRRPGPEWSAAGRPWAGTGWLPAAGLERGGGRARPPGPG